MKLARARSFVAFALTFLFVRAALPAAAVAQDSGAGPLRIEIASECGETDTMRTRIALSRSASEQDFLRQLERQNLRLGVFIEHVEGSPSLFEVRLEFAHVNRATGADENLETRSERDASCANLMEYAIAVVAVWWNTADAEAEPPAAPSATLREPAGDLGEPIPTRPDTATHLPLLLAANAIAEGGMLTVRDATPSFGAELEMHVPLNDWLSLATALTVLFPRSKALAEVPESRVQSAYGAASVAFCYTALHLVSERDTWLPCVGLESGALFGESSGIRAAGSGFSPSLLLLGGVLFRYAFAEQFGLEVGVTGFLTLIRPQLVVDGIGSVHQSDIGQIRGKLGLWFAL